jgi:tetratricopeptide (TPR) repeat protein
MLVADGRLEESDGAYRPVGELGELAIPDTLRSLIASRLDGLDTADRTLLQRGAVLGQTFTADTLAAVSDGGADLEARLKRLVRREILYVQADPRSPERGQYGFVQSLIREVAYGMLSRRERRERHLAAARHFEALGDDELAGVLASHYVAALRASEPGAEADSVAAQARIALRGAADRAGALGAYGQAANHLRTALEVTTADADRADLLERLANALDNDGHYGEAVESARAAMDAYRVAERPESVARVVVVLAASLLHGGRPVDAAVAVTDALPAATNNPELRARLLSRLSRAHMVNQRADASVAAADEALAIAEAHEMVDVVAETLNNKGAALDQLGRWREATLLMEGAFKFAESAASPEVYLRIANNLASVLGADDPQRAVQVLRTAIDLGRRWGIRSGLNFMTNHLAVTIFHTGGDFDEAEQLLVRGYEEAGDDADRALLMGNVVLFRLVRRAADESDIERWKDLAAAWESRALESFSTAIRATSAHSRGDLAAAHRGYDDAVRIEPLDYASLGFLLDTSIALGDEALIRDAAARNLAIVHTGRVPKMSKSWAAASLKAIDGEPSQAVAAFAEVDQLAGEIGYEFWRAVAALDALTLLPERTELRAAAEAAVIAFEKWQAAPYIERAKAALAKASALTPERNQLAPQDAATVPA